MSAPGASPGDEVLARFVAAVDGRRSDLVAIRRDIHRHPDASGQEARTAGIVAGVLRDAGFDVTTEVGGHGVVGVLRGTSGAAGSAGAAGAKQAPVLAFRADMDAVRGVADDPMDFRSVNPGVNHNCGHDIHTAVGLALAVGLAGIRDQLPGTVVLVFQPAEETASGARAMLADGLFGDAPPDAIFAYHTAPYPVGEIVTRPGTLLPGRDRLVIDIRGDGDLNAVARDVRTLVAALATPGSNERSRPASEDFVRFMGVRPAARTGAGSRQVVATLTTSGARASRSAREQLERGLAGLRRPGLELDLEYREGFIAGASNDPALVARSTAAARGVLGEAGVREAQSLTTIFSEDFGSFQEGTPGVMYFLGVSNPARGWVGMPHTPSYVADEEAIFVGAEVMAAVFLDLMRDGVPHARK